MKLIFFLFHLQGQAVTPPFPPFPLPPTVGVFSCQMSHVLDEKNKDPPVGLDSVGLDSSVGRVYLWVGCICGSGLLPSADTGITQSRSIALFISLSLSWFLSGLRPKEHLMWRLCRFRSKNKPFLRFTTRWSQCPDNSAICKKKTNSTNPELSTVSSETDGNLSCF